MPKVGGRRKKVKSHRQTDAAQERLIPKTFIFKKGKCSLTCRELTRDIRKCFYPHTALKIQDSNRIGIKTYLRAAKYYSVTHLLAFQQTKNNSLLRVIRVGGGQMRFKIINYCRMKDILKNGGQPFSTAMNEPLLVLNGFNLNKQTEKIGKALQQMFPPLLIQKAKVSGLKRVVSFTYQPNKKVIYFRHYKITKNQGGLTSTFKNLISNIKKIDFSQFKSFSQAFGEEIQEQAQGSDNQQTVKLQEIGPRMKLRFFDYIQGIGRQQFEQDQQQLQQQENQKQQEGGNQQQQVEEKMQEASPQIQEL